MKESYAFPFPLPFPEGEGSFKQIPSPLKKGGAIIIEQLARIDCALLTQLMLGERFFSASNELGTAGRVLLNEFSQQQGISSMLGTLVNTGAVVVGSLIGLSIGSRLPERIKLILMQALGLSVMVVGVRMALEGKHSLLAIACLLVGGVTGEVLHLEQSLENLAENLRQRFHSESSSFVQGFVTATSLYLTGAMTVVGSIQDGTVGDSTLLLVKSLLDGVASVALASSLGSGVLFAALPVFLIQGGITLLAGKLTVLSEPVVLDVLNATGGLLILGIGINLLNLGRIHIGNLLPAVFYAVASALWFL